MDVTKISAAQLREEFGKGDRKRDAGLTTPADITRCDDLHYGPEEYWNAMDIYFPKGTESKLPTIVNVHGGGYVYGDKGVYQFYCMSLAQRGFTVVNFNYHLAPEAQFPAPILDTNQVMEWVCAHAEEYHIDVNNIFLTGDSAGAQLASQYALVWADPAYAALFGLKVPAFRLGAVCLNCGMYDLSATAKNAAGAIACYFDPAHVAAHPEQYAVLERIDSRYPPVYLMSSAHDFLLANWQPMHQLLTQRDVAVEGRVYGGILDVQAGHVFHCNMRYPLAHECNDEEAAFLRKYVK